MEIDETLTVRRKFNRGRVLKQLRLFSGIERLSKRRFVVALNSPTGDKRNSATLLPLIEKYIKPGLIIYSDAWPAYKSIIRFTQQTLCHQNCDFCRNPHTDNREILARSQIID